MSLEHVDTVFAFAVVMLLLSLVITVAVQSVVAALGLRGRNLVWGLTNVLERSPKLQGHATKIANEVANHAALTATGKKATEIGSKELLSVLRDISDDPATSLPKATKDALKEALGEMVPQESQAHAKQLAEEFKKLFPAEAGKMEEALGLFQQKSKKLVNDLDTWFDTVMSRTTDRFVAQTRRWTIVFAIILAVLLQIDSLALLKNLSTDAELRATLVQGAEQTLTRADTVLLAKSIAVEALEATKAELSELEWKEIPATLTTRSEGRAWVTESFKESDEVPQVEEAYLAQFDKLTRERLGALGNQMLELRSDLEESRMVILPTTWPAFTARWKGFFGNLLGVILSVLLLSLGAPFWFNALRSLAALRPVLAGRADPSKPATT